MRSEIEDISDDISRDHGRLRTVRAVRPAPSEITSFLSYLSYPTNSSHRLRSCFLTTISLASLTAIMPNTAPNPPVLFSFSNPGELTDALANFIVRAQKEAVEKKGRLDAGHHEEDQEAGQKGQSHDDEEGDDASVEHGGIPGLDGHDATLAQERRTR